MEGGTTLLFGEEGEQCDMSLQISEAILFYGAPSNDGDLLPEKSTEKLQKNTIDNCQYSCKPTTLI